jgi:hypothetical protein
VGKAQACPPFRKGDASWWARRERAFAHPTRLNVTAAKSQRSIRIERDRTERLQQLLVELATHRFHDRKRPRMRERQPIGALLDQRRVDVDDRRQADDIADLAAE